ncbi:hypothetical protein Taro_039083 [Colocasia esculenta]|uniref:Uncharacterized protein n=1 Tax=Colocasia esculenta TaxID=4460 RepID=A0A843WP45_COLES|nr:hypothetical protein [Colocasia esculenta]
MENAVFSPSLALSPVTYLPVALSPCQPIPRSGERILQAHSAARESLPHRSRSRLRSRPCPRLRHIGKCPVCVIDNVANRLNNLSSPFLTVLLPLFLIKLSNVEFKKILDKSFPYKRELDILCGKTTVRGCHFMGSTEDVDVESRRSFGDDDSVGREQFSDMGLESNQIHSVDNDNFNPFFYPPSSQYYPSSQPVRDKTPTNNQPNEDEATSPEKRQSIPAYMVSRKRKSKKALDPMALAQYCMLKNEQINLAKNLFPGSSSAPSAQ